jgi:hypothetical protein
MNGCGPRLKEFTKLVDGLGDGKGAQSTNMKRTVSPKDRPHDSSNSADGLVKRFFDSKDSKDWIKGETNPCKVKKEYLDKMEKDRETVIHEGCINTLKAIYTVEQGPDCNPLGKQSWSEKRASAKTCKKMIREAELTGYKTAGFEEQAPDSPDAPDPSEKNVDPANTGGGDSGEGHAEGEGNGPDPKDGQERGGASSNAPNGDNYNSSDGANEGDSGQSNAKNDYPSGNPETEREPEQGGSGQPTADGETRYGSEQCSQGDSYSQAGGPSEEYRKLARRKVNKQSIPPAVDHQEVPDVAHTLNGPEQRSIPERGKGSPSGGHIHFGKSRQARPIRAPESLKILRALQRT